MGARGAAGKAEQVGYRRRRLRSKADARPTPQTRSKVTQNSIRRREPAQTSPLLKQLELPLESGDCVA